MQDTYRLAHVVSAGPTGTVAAAASPHFTQLERLALALSRLSHKRCAIFRVKLSLELEF